ncbi:MAG: UDP-N-acetylmuramoyl-tripeptide--D-alanyl-D-alanine ligase [Gammaproteobacteria bacterium]|nr:UDP-N-acetylmuramoyl-tripeptide--D-alanyl-D-alanine ligase [Gammaproteobacteria bacterium]
MKLSKLATILNAELKGVDVEFFGINTDSREIKPNDLYIARKGNALDGHDFLGQAKTHGASGAIVERFIHIDDLPQIKVQDATLALGKMAAWQRVQFKNPLFALTGSCGKTTTKELLAAILRTQGEVLVNVRSFNNAVGVPLTLWNINPSQKFAVLELGANHFSEISYLANLVQPIHVAAITNAAPCHLEGFGDVAGVARAKAEIFAGLAANGTAVLNSDDEYYSYWQKIVATHTKVIFGFKSKADISATNITFDAAMRALFQLKLPETTVEVALPLLGKHNVMNALTAAACAYAIGINPEAIKFGLENVIAVKMRLNLQTGLCGAKIIDDTYNANPKAVAAALEILVEQPGEKIFVFGGMRELGEDAEKWHRYIGQLAKELQIDALYVCGEFAKVVSDSFGSAGFAFKTQEELIPALQKNLDANKVVLVKGSRGAKMEKVVQALLIN